MRKEIILILDETLEKGIVETVTCPVDSLEVNLVGLIIPHVTKNSYISFGEYYENTDMMNYDNCFPYILRDEKYEWVVPYKDVTVEDFIVTHGIKNEPSITIKAEINDVGGGDPFLATTAWEWIVFFWPLVVEGLVTIGGLFTFQDYISKAVKSFSRSISRTPVPSDVAEVINKRKTWRLEKLGRILGIDNESLLRSILICCGFHEKDGVYRRNLIRYRRYESQSFNYISDCWGSYDYCYDDPLNEIRESIQGINILLTDIKLHSELMKSDSFEIAIYQTYSVIKRYRYLKKGKYFRFIEAKDSIVNIEKDEIDELYEELEELMTYLENLVDYLRAKDFFSEE